MELMLGDVSDPQCEFQGTLPAPPHKRQLKGMQPVTVEGFLAGLQTVDSEARLMNHTVFALSRSGEHEQRCLLTPNPLDAWTAP